MEKRYHARWWDYSQKPMNLHGRIWIGNLALFGLGGVLIVNGVNPVLLPLLEGMGLLSREVLAGGLLALIYDEDSATPQMRQIKRDIDAQLERLSQRHVTFRQDGAERDAAAGNGGTAWAGL